MQLGEVPARDPDLALRFWTDGINAHIQIDEGPQDRAIIINLLRTIADTMEKPPAGGMGGPVSLN